MKNLDILMQFLLKFQNTLQHALMWKVLQNRENSKDLKHGFHFIHRLDFATSGVICLGKNKNASAAAGKLFESRVVDKYYIALVRGNIKDEFITVDVAMGTMKTLIFKYDFVFHIR